MAMNKKERAEMERLREDLALAKAMKWPDYPMPSTVTRQWIDDNLVDGGVKYNIHQKVARGWFYNANILSFNRHRPTYGCSNGMTHAVEGDVTTSQSAGRMFATKLDALRALRLDLTEQCATILASVDKQIAECDE